MNSIPLQYESLKAVLLYMEPNVRFIIAHRAPTTRSTERTVPLRVKWLNLDEYSTTVNNTSYRLGIYRDCDADEKIPRHIEMKNADGGVPWDLDRHGFPVASGFSALKPGDILIGNSDHRDFQYDTVQIERSYQKTLKCCERALYLLSNPSEALEEEENFYDDMSKEELESFIDYIQACLLPFECRRFSLKPPYTYFIQLTIRSGENRQIQRFAYKMKLHEATKRLNNFLFGGRRSPIQTRELYIHNRSMILRLPIGFQVRPKQLRYLSNLENRYDSISSMLDSSYFLFDLVSIYARQRDNFQFPIVTSAKTLVIHNLDIIFDVSSLIRKCSNQHVVLADSLLFITAEQLFEAVQLWLEGSRSIGTSFSLGIEKEETVKELFKLIKARVEITKRTKRCVSMRTQDNSRLEVFYVPNKSNKEQIMYGYDSKWILKIRAVQF